MRNLVLLLLFTVATSPVRAGIRVESAAEARAEALRKVSAQLICQCSCNMILSECSHQNCPFALPERLRILSLIDEGKSTDDIVAIYVSESGRSILSSPPTDASFLDRIAWLVPIAALVAGLITAIPLAVRFTRRGASVASEGESAAVASYRERVARDLEAGSGHRK